VEWLFDATRNVYSSPVIDAGGNIYFAAIQAGFFSVGPSGTLLWQKPGGAGDGNPTIGGDGTVYIFGDTSLYAYTPGGTLKWRSRVQLVRASAGTAGPVISKDGGLIIVPQGDLVAFRADGSLAWRVRPDSLDLFMYEPAFSVDGSTLYASGQYRLYAVDTSGIIKWRFPVPGLSGSGVAPTSVAVDNAGNLYFAQNSRLYSLFPNGALRWQSDEIYNYAGLDAGPAIGRDGTIYLSGMYLYAFDNAGKLRWKYSLPANSGSIPAIDSSGTVYVGCNTNRTASDSINFVALHPDGTVKFRMSLRSPDNTVPDIDSRPAISADGKIYVGSDRPHGTHLYKIK
jgi:hypothetical protein